ncbi:MAG: Cys-rich protein [Leptospiraceae bacterium]|nr:Cys-rich protein [Leptospiraceae bacterium]
MNRFFFTIIFLMYSGCTDPVETKCQSACNFFIKCTEEVNNIKITGQELNTGVIQCMKGCTRFQSEILSCYTEESDSCKGMAECMIQSGLGE